MPTRLSIWLAVLAYGGSFVALARKRWGLSRIVFSIGCIAYVIHVVCAFHFHYEWSHTVGLQQTAEQTKAVTGIDTNLGIYANYLFTLIWIADAAWWWIVGDARYSKRRWQWTFAVHFIFVFMIFNGAVVFATGPARWIGIATLSAVLIALINIAVSSSRRDVKQSES